MANSTVYDIRLRYLLQDKVSGRLGRVQRSLDRTANSAGFLERGLRRATAIGAGAFGVRTAAKHLIGFNAQMEDLKLNLAGMISMATTTDFSEALVLAEGSLGRFRQAAKASVGTTKDMVAMGVQIAQPIFSASSSMLEFEKLAVNAVVASKALGVQSEVAARDIDQAIRGQFRSVDVFTGKLLGALGFLGEEGRRAFNELGIQARKAKIAEALTLPAITELAKAQEKSFSGVYSTLQDNLQTFLGSVGKPLFEAITTELQRWNTWIERNQATVDRIAKTLATGLVDFFGVVKTTVQFFVDNKDTLLLVAKTWAGFRVGKLAGGLLGGALQRGGGLLERKGLLLLNRGFDVAGRNSFKVGSTFTDLAGKITKSLIPGIGGAVLALEGLSSWWANSGLSKEEEQQKQTLIGTTGSLLGVLERRRQAALTRVKLTGQLTGLEKRFLTGKETLQHSEAVKELGFRGREGDVGAARFTPLKPEEIEAAGLTGFRSLDAIAYQLASRRLAETQEELATATNSLLQHALETGFLTRENNKWVLANKEAAKLTADRLGLTESEYSKVLKGLTLLEEELKSGRLKVQEALGLQEPKAAPDPNVALQGRGAPADNGKPPKVNVTIQRIEVKSDDPDRFVFGMVSAFSDSVKNPVGAWNTVREG